MAAAIIELDSLPDAVRPTTENDHLLALRGLCLVLLFVRRIHVWSEALEFGSARINPLVHRTQAVLAPCIAHPFFGAASVAVARNEPCQAGIGESHALGLAQFLRAECFQRLALKFPLRI